MPIDALPSARLLAIFLTLLGASVFLGCGDTYYETIQQEEPPFFPPSAVFAGVCADPEESGQPAGLYTDENNWLRSWSHETYLWYDEIKDQDPACCSTPAYFELMKTFETNAAGDPKDRFHFTRTAQQYRQSQQSISIGYGAEFVILRGAPPRDVRIAYTEPDSPATAPGVALARGARILAIDGESMITSNNLPILIGGLEPSKVDESHTFTVIDLGSNTPRTVTMVSQVIEGSPVQKVDILTASNGDRIGYMLFNEHSRPAGQAIIDAGRYFVENGGIDDLVVDLRYNGGGLVYVAQILSSMIAGTEKEGETFEEFETNGKYKEVEGKWEFTLDFTDENLGVVPSLGLRRLFVLTSGGTCSASESVINSLRGVDVDVIVIGSATCGKPYGFIPTENCGTYYYSIHFRGVNAKGEADFEKGFIPTCDAVEDFNHLLGDKEEILLKTALAYQSSGSCPDAGAAAAQITLEQTQALPGETLSLQPSGLQGKMIIGPNN